MDRTTTEKLYSIIIRTAMDGFWLVDIHGRFLDVNEAYCRLTGYSREELLKMGITDVEIVETPEDTAAHIRKIIDAGSDRFTTRHRCKKGAIIDLEVSVNYTGAEGGRMFAFLRDITAIKKAEGLKRHQENIEELYNLRTEAMETANEALKEEITLREKAQEELAKSERWLRLMADSLPVLISYVNKERRYGFTNRRYEEIFGLAREEIKGSFVKDILGDEAYNDIAPYMDKALAGERIDYERAFFFPGSGERYLRVSYVPDFGVHGRIKGFFVLGYDITEHQNMTQQLRRYAKQLADSEETQKRSLGRELHDQLGPVLTALGFNLHILKSELPADASDLGARLDESNRLVEQAAEDIRHVLTGLRPPLLDDYGLLPALRDYCEHFSERNSINVDIQGEDPGPRMRPQIELGLFRVAQEALTNVARHAEASQVTVTVERTGDRLRLSIEDNGKGFDASGLREHNGLCGWGLTTMSERVEAMGGTFRVESSVGCGVRVIAEVSL